MKEGKGTDRKTLLSQDGHIAYAQLSLVSARALIQPSQARKGEFLTLSICQILSSLAVEYVLNPIPSVHLTTTYEFRPLTGLI